MDNKLSELSKPVAWPNGCNETSVKALRYLAEHKRPIGGSDMHNTEHLYMIARELEIMSSQHLYSQEYVSALDKVAQFWIGESAEWKKRAEDAEKRIAELESIRADASQVFKEIGNELGCNPDNESIMMAIDALKEREKRVVALAGGSAELWETMAARLEAAEAKLATPVRLPLLYSPDPWMSPDPDGTWLDKEDVKKSIRTAGFTVEGDE